MNWLDIVIIVMLAISVFIGLSTGLIKSVLSLAGVIFGVGVFFTTFFFDQHQVTGSNTRLELQKPFVNTAQVTFGESVIVHSNYPPQFLVHYPGKMANGGYQEGISNSLFFQKLVFQQVEKTAIIFGYTLSMVAVIY